MSEFCSYLISNMAPTTIKGPSHQPSLRAVMDLLKDIGERLNIQEHRILHLTDEKMAEGQEKLLTPSLPHLISGLHRRCNERQSSPHQDHQLPQPANYDKKGLSKIHCYPESIPSATSPCWYHSYVRSTITKCIMCSVWGQAKSCMSDL